MFFNRISYTWICINFFRSTATGAVPRTTKVDEEKTKTLSKTYHTIKDMISSRFGPNRKEADPEPEASLNNVTEELRKTSRDIGEEEAKKKEGVYGKSRTQDSSLNMQQYPKNSYGTLLHSLYSSLYSCHYSFHSLYSYFYSFCSNFRSWYVCPKNYSQYLRIFLILM